MGSGRSIHGALRPLTGSTIGGMTEAVCCLLVIAPLAGPVCHCCRVWSVVVVLDVLVTTR
jgi:sorbitol-specific phosphotransferase system component IIBC